MLPEGFLRRMERTLGADYPAFLQTLARPRAVGLRLNTLKVSADFAARLPFGFAAGGFLPFAEGLPEQMRRSFDHAAGLIAVPWAENGYYYNPETRPGLHPFHETGAYYLQEPSAMLPAELLDVRPGMRVLDLCAAPGGKTTQIAAKMQGRGLLIANEIHPQRARILARNVERCAVANAIVLNEHPEKLAKRFVGFFDRILVDAPCSGEGMFKKEDAAAADWSEEAVSACARRQTEILRSAVTMLAPNGRLVYSTCTFSEEENERVAENLCKESGVTLLRMERVLPHERVGEGQFAAVLEKTDGETTDFATKKPTASDAEKAAAAFAKENGLALPQGRLVPFGENVWCAPDVPVELAGLNVLRCGLELGAAKKSVFTPAHAWALWLNDAPQKADFAADGAEIAAFLRGETLPGSARGWTLITADGLSLGWAKGSDGILKNHYPKGLRRIAAQNGRGQSL